jgi:hypothetical protein
VNGFKAEVEKGFEATWHRVETAAAQSGGRFRGLVRHAAPVVPGERWLAWAERAPGQPSAQGVGERPIDALNDLGKVLGELS